MRQAHMRLLEGQVTMQRQSNLMKQESMEWVIRLTPVQRVFHSLSNVVVTGIIPFLIEIYLIVLFWGSPNYFFIYIPALVAVVWFQCHICKPESFYPKNRNEKLIVRIDNKSIHYGVSGREIKIDYPISKKRGLLGCVNLEFGPTYYLPVPKNVAYDEGLLDELRKEGLLMEEE